MGLVGEVERMSAIYYDGGETETSATAEAPWERPVDVCSINAGGQANVVRSGAVGLDMIGDKRLFVNPKWADTAQDFFWIHVKIAAKNVPAGGPDGTDSVLFCTTPNPYADAGRWFLIQFQCNATSNEIVAVEGYAGVSQGTPLTIAPHGSFSVTPGPHWYAFRLWKGDGVSASTLEVFVDDVSRFTLTGSGLPDTVNSRVAFGAAVSLDSKGSPVQITFECDDIIILDEDASGEFDGRMVEALSSGVIIGFPPDADVTGFNDYTTTGSPTASPKKYRHVDDFNRTHTGDDYITAASPHKQLFRLPDISDASPTVHSVRLDASPRVVDTVGHQFLAGVSDEGVGPETITGWDDGVTGYVTHLRHTTPRDGNAWSKDKFNKLFVGLTKVSTTHQIRVLGVQVLGIDISQPTANPDSDNADVADPWGVVERLTDWRRPYSQPKPIAQLAI